MPEITDAEATIDIDDLTAHPGGSEFLGDAVIELFQDDEGQPREVVPTALIWRGKVAALIEPPEDAGPAEDEPAPAHDHQWAILGAQPHTPAALWMAKPVPHTIVLIRCTECGEPDSRMLPGEWTLEVLQATGEQQR